MPVIFNADEGKEWLLEPKPDRLLKLLQSPVESLRAFPVSRRVNDPADDSEEIIKPAE
jgi:putative SOS response-associated peptidase YedK